MNNGNLSENARRLRKNMTPEEKQLWYQFLKDLPVTIHRQRVIGPYIVDFYCASAKLIIELDGSQHYEEDQIKKDAVRDKYFNDRGYNVKRYYNRDIHYNFYAVCEDIKDIIFGKDEAEK